MPLEGPAPEPGDMIEFDHGHYQHLAVYIGRGKVVHLTFTDTLGSNLSSVAGTTGEVREDSLEDVADGCTYRVNNKYDEKWKPHPPQEIVKAARKAVGKEMYYNILTDNCEHFVTGLRYGRSFSDQVDNSETSDESDWSDEGDDSNETNESVVNNNSAASGVGTVIALIAGAALFTMFGGKK